LLIHWPRDGAKIARREVSLKTRFTKEFLGCERTQVRLLRVADRLDQLVRIDRLCRMPA